MKRGLLISAALIGLVACGGGGGSSPPPTSGPSPTPAPSPTPTPTPTPPPIEPPARVVAGSTGPSAWPFVTTFPFTFDELLAEGTGSTVGQYAPGFANGFTDETFFADGLDPETDLSGRHKIASFIDPNTGIHVLTPSLPEARVISPLTALLVNGPSQEKLKRQLGVTENVFRLRTIDPDLNTFDPIAELQNADPDIVIDAERLLAANIRALALCRALSNFCDATTSFGLSDDGGLQAALAAAPDKFLFNDNAAMTDVVARTRRYGGLSRDLQSAIAHLIDAYAAAVALRIDRPEFAAKFLMGIEGFLLPRLREIDFTRSTVLAAQAQATTSQDILDAIQRFEDSLPIPDDTRFFPAPDYYETPINTPITMLVPGTGVHGPVYPRDNDVFAFRGFSFATSDIDTVEVPQINAGEVSASINAERAITLTPATGFVGLTYVDYTITHETGATGRARIFLRVMPTN